MQMVLSGVSPLLYIGTPYGSVLGTNGLWISERITCSTFLVCHHAGVLVCDIFKETIKKPCNFGISLHLVRLRWHYVGEITVMGCRLYVFLAGKHQ